jgi:hypothetical protein
MARTIKLYSHDEYEDWLGDYPEAAEERTEYISEHASDPSVTEAEFHDVIRDKPLYEVEFVFDVDTKKCVGAVVAGVRLVPEAES